MHHSEYSPSTTPSQGLPDEIVPIAAGQSGSAPWAAPHDSGLALHIRPQHWEKYGPTEGIALPKHQAAPKDMPGIAFTYEMDGQTAVNVFDEQHPIPGPDNPNDPCPFCGPVSPACTP